MIRVLLLLFSLALAGDVFAQAYAWNSSYPSGYADARAKIRLVRSSFPANRTIWYFNDVNWVQMTVGPSYSDQFLTIHANSIPYVGYGLYSRGHYSNLTVVGTSQSISIAPAYRIQNFSLTLPGQQNSEYQDVQLMMGGTTASVSRVSGGGYASVAFDRPDLVIRASVIEGQLRLIADEEQSPDTDGDGIPDELDPDDDNDGISDDNDDFPKDPNESNDQDGDGIGDNADPDDDNDGHPDNEDSFPYDPDRWKPDQDNDGTPDDEDAFPTNPWEDEDKDGDGIGGNTDPDDNSPTNTGTPGGGGGGSQPPPGTGGGGPGGGNPTNPPWGGGTDIDGDGNLDISNDPSANAGFENAPNPIAPGAGMNIAGAWGALKEAVSNKFLNFSPFGDGGLVPKTTVLTIDFPGVGIVPSLTGQLNFGEAPWTWIRAVILAFIVAAFGISFLKRVTI